VEPRFETSSSQNQHQQQRAQRGRDTTTTTEQNGGPESVSPKSGDGRRRNSMVSRMSMGTTHLSRSNWLTDDEGNGNIRELKKIIDTKNLHHLNQINFPVVFFAV